MPVVSYLHSDEHFVLGGTKIITLCQEDLPKGAFTELALQHDVSSLYVLHVCGGKKKTKALVYGKRKKIWFLYEVKLRQRY